MRALGKLVNEVALGGFGIRRESTGLVLLPKHPSADRSEEGGFAGSFYFSLLQAEPLTRRRAGEGGLSERGLVDDAANRPHAHWRGRWNASLKLPITGITQADPDEYFGLPGWITYSDTRFFAAEKERILAPSWQVVCHLNNIPANRGFLRLRLYRREHHRDPWPQCSCAPLAMYASTAPQGCSMGLPGNAGYRLSLSCLEYNLQAGSSASHCGRPTGTRD